MKFKLLLPLLLFTLVCKAEHNVKIYFEPFEGGFHAYADNGEFCEMSVKIDFQLTNLEVEGENKAIYVLKPNNKKQLLTTLTFAIKGNPSKFTSRYWVNYGNHYSDEYDEHYEYFLPFGSSRAFVVYQGYFGDFSHQKEHALDFTMPVGTEINAIREGIVIKVVDSNSKNCDSEECKKFNNLIVIYHPDGTFAEYTHIKKNGSIVQVGDKVARGQKIGFSGNVGWSTGPHLHLVVYKQKLETRITIETKFKIGDGETAEVLVEKNKYSRNY